MTIKVGDKVPSVALKKVDASAIEDINFADYLKNKKAIVFAVPGAFTPACHEKHLPGYIKNAAALKSQGIDEIICVAVNDPFVMRAWAKETGAEGKITMVPDGNAALTKSLGLDFDGSGHALGIRSKRYSMIVQDGKVMSLHVENKPGDVDLSAAETCLIELKSAA